MPVRAALAMAGLGRTAAPPPFEWGVASSAFQIEGAHATDGKGPSIWDTFSHTPGRVAGGDTGDVACDFYHRYKDDVALMKSLGVRSFRFSLAWSRILPAGVGEVNPAGVAFYHRLLDELDAAGITPHISLYHWDLPQALDDEYGGWLNERSVADFAAYAEVAFREYGPRVKHWSTFNEPYTFAFCGYSLGIHAPGKKVGGMEVQALAPPPRPPALATASTCALAPGPNTAPVSNTPTYPQARPPTPKHTQLPQTHPPPTYSCCRPLL